MTGPSSRATSANERNSHETLLQVENLEVSYGEARALNGISFAIESGSLFAIVGSNGAGKTSLVRSIGGMLRPRAGRIVFDGVDTTISIRARPANSASVKSRKAARFFLRSRSRKISCSEPR